MRKLAKASSMLMMVNLSEMMVRLLRTKCIAVLLGVAGSGMMAQLTLLVELLRGWCSLGTRRAVIRQIGESRKNGDDASYAEALRTSLTLELFVSCVIAGAASLFSRNISFSLFGTEEYFMYVAVIVWALPFAALATLFSTVLKALMEYRLLASYSLWAIVAVAVFVPPAVFFFKYWGMLAAMFAFFVFPLAALLWLNFKRPYLCFSTRINWGMLKELAADGLNLLYQQSTGNIVRLVLASLVVRSLGLDGMGIYQVVLTLTTVYLTIPIQSISGYAMPVIAAAPDNARINATVNDSLRFLCLIMMPVVIGLILWSEFLIELLYSTAFLAALPVLRLQLVGTVFDILNQSLGSALAAKGKLRPLYWLSTFHPAVYFAVSWVLFRHWALAGLAAGFVTAQAFTTAYLIVLNRKYFAYSFRASEVKLLFMLGLWIALALLVVFGGDRVAFRIVVSLFVVPWAYFNLSARERSAVYKWVLDKVAVRRFEHRGGE